MDIDDPLDPRHRELRELLPWYATGRLDALDRARVADHLAACAVCRAEVTRERDVRDRVAAMPLAVDLGWERLRQRIAPVPVSLPVPRRRSGRVWSRIADHPRAVAGVIAAQFALLVAGVLVLPPRPPAAAYHVLGSATPAPVGNVIVMLRADATTGRLAAMLAASDARIVDGPTDAGAFVLAVPAERRAAALARLKAAEGVTLAEPLDP